MCERLSQTWDPRTLQYIRQYNELVEMRDGELLVSRVYITIVYFFALYSSFPTHIDN